jgi:putative Holliday junction resolvase
MGRIMAIDYGAKRVGVAVTDPLKIIANGLPTVETVKIFSFLKEYVPKESVESFVVGYPKNLRNEDMEITKKVSSFVELLKKNFPSIPVHLVDERFTSKMASQTIAQSGLPKKQRQQKELIDKISAVIILQNFLETKHS